MLGYSDRELLNKPWAEVCHPEKLATALDKEKRLWNDPGCRLEVEGRYIHRNGSEAWARMKIALIRGSDGTPLYSVLHVEDITGRKRSQAAHRESGGHFRVMAGYSPSMMSVFDRAEFLNRLMDDEELMQEVIQKFLADAPRQIEALRKLAALKDVKGSGLKAHMIKGAASNVGGESMRAVAGMLEQAGKTGDLELIDAGLEDLEHQFLKLKDAMTSPSESSEAIEQHRNAHR